jgi:hypothetical protein
MDLAAQLGHRILPLLQGWAGRLRAEFPHVTAHASGDPGRGFRIDCGIQDAAADQVDRVALSVSLRDVDGTLMMQSADVAWGHPSGHIEAEILATPAALTPELIEAIADRLPELFAGLRQAIRRGHPPA